MVDEERFEAFWRFVDGTDKLVKDAIDAGLTCREITNILELHANGVRELFGQTEEKKESMVSERDNLDARR